MIYKTLTAALACATVAACASIPQENKTGPLIDGQIQKPALREARPAPFLRQYEANSAMRTEDIQVTDAPLFSVIRAALPGVTITPMDSSVDMSMKVSMLTGPMPVREWLDTLMNITNQNYEYKGGAIIVSSVVTKSWRMPAFATQAFSSATATGQSSQSGTGGSGGTVSGVPSSPGQGAVPGQSNTNNNSGGAISSGASGDRGTSLTISRQVDEWDQLIKAVEQYADSVTSMRTQGYITATGRPLAMRELDRIMTSFRKASEENIAFDVTIFEVNLTDQRARGIDWSTILDGEINVGAGGVFSTTVDASFPAILDGVTTGGINLDFSSILGTDTPVDIMLNLLSQFGTVELNQQPKVMSLNGKPAMVSSGEEFGFLSEVRSTVTANLATVEPTVERILIGVQLQITGTKTDDGMIMVEVVPVISNLRGFDNIEVAGNEFQQPRIALQQLATTTVARPGEPIQIGGLMQSRIARTLNGLPIGQKESLGFLGYLFESETNEVDRSELVIMITPSLVGA